MHLGGHRKMKNDEEYFLQKLSCGILRVRRFNKIVRLREPLQLHQETPPGSTHETYTDSIPLPDTSTEHDLYLFPTVSTRILLDLTSSHNITM